MKPVRNGDRSADSARTLGPSVGGNHDAPAGSFCSGEVIRIIHERLINSINLTEARRMSLPQLQTECTQRVDTLISQLGFPLTAHEKQQLIRDVMDEIFGLGPIETLLHDDSVSDVLVNGAGPGRVYVERLGRLEPATVSFQDDDHLIRVIQRIANAVGRRIDESSPMLDARLADGSRVNAIIPPLTLDGPVMSIRRFGKIPIEINRLLGMGSMLPEMSDFLRACVQSRRSILISGGTGSGKTTLLNVLSKWIPPRERVITIEDAAELRLQREHVVRLETRPPNIEGKGEITQRDLVRNALRMRPDRIIVGEVRGGEALDMLQAMNTGHEGSMTTVHANTPRDAIRRVENMVSMAGLDYPVKVIRQQIASAINVLVQLSRLTGGQRKIVNIAEVTGMEGDAVCIQDIFVYQQTGVDADGHATGSFEATGVRPRALDKFREEGIVIDPGSFQRHVLQPQPAGQET